MFFLLLSPLHSPFPTCHPVSPAISALLFLHRSAQQRSSQTNKSQSSAGNQVNICHVLYVTHKQRSTRSREYCTPTQQQHGYCREEKRMMLKWKRSDPRYSFFLVNLLHCTHFMLHTFLPYVFLDIIIILYFSHACVQWFVCFFGFIIFISVKESHWVLLLYATIITGVVETFPFVWTLPVSSRCHFAFHPHPLVRISAALLWVSVGEYRSLWVMVCNVICACSNTSAHCVVLSSAAA